jgi:hypothetical protein
MCACTSAHGAGTLPRLMKITMVNTCKSKKEIVVKEYAPAAVVALIEA